MNIFLDNADYKLFLNRLVENVYPNNTPIPVSKHGYVRKSLPVGSFDLLSYCLMPNHFHILIRQNTNLPTSKLITKICTGYSKCFNKKYDRVGPLFQDQFKAAIVKSNKQLLWLSAYIHMNPVKAGLVSKLEQYEYSSYLEYINQTSKEICVKNYILDQCKHDSKVYIKNLLDVEKTTPDSTLLIDET